jgi:hypothetical protein
VTECGLVVPKYFWVLSMELLVTFLGAQNFEVAPGLFENLRTLVPEALDFFFKENRKFYTLV